MPDWLLSEKKQQERKMLYSVEFLMNRGRREINVFGLYANTIPIFYTGHR